MDNIKSHNIDLQLNQIKDHLKTSVEVTCRGAPGAIFMVSTMRIFNFPAQGIHTLTKALLLKRLHSFEKDKRHIRKISTTSRGGETPDRVSILLNFLIFDNAKMCFFYYLLLHFRHARVANLYVLLVTLLPGSVGLSLLISQKNEQAHYSQFFKIFKNLNI